MASGPKWNRKSSVKHRLHESRILQLVLIPSHRPAPKSTFIPIRLLKCTLLQHTAIFQVMNYVLKWLSFAVNDFLSRTKTNDYLSRSKRVALYILKFCGSLVISHEAVLSCVASSKWALFFYRPCIFIPHPTFKISVITHPISISILIPHPAKPMLDPHKRLRPHFVFHCCRPLYFRTKKLLSSSSKWE